MTEKFKRPGSVGDRDTRIPKERPMTPAGGTPVWLDEPTDVRTDAQVFRAVKAIGEEMHKSKIEAARAHGALKQEVTTFKRSVDDQLATMSGEFNARMTKQDLVMERMAGQLDVLVPAHRQRPSSAEQKAVEAEKTKRTRMTTNAKVIIAIATAAIATIGTVLVAVLA